MTAYYNEIDPYAAQWLRNLIAAGHIAPGDVDERSIEDVYPDDLRGYTQCHWFAGIAVWSYALRRAGWPDDRPVWTGSCPCQPFSEAGKGTGFDDERHLWPAWHHFIKERRPAIIFGEQVAAKNAEPWIDLVHADLEAMGYAFGAVPFPSAGVGAPHIRDRLFWVADASEGEWRRRPEHEPLQPDRQETRRHEIPGDLERHRRIDGLADPKDIRRKGELLRARSGVPSNGTKENSIAVRLANPEQHHSGCEATAADHIGAQADRPADQHSGHCSSPTAWPGPVNGFWANADWLLCRDGKWRPVEPGTFPLAHGAASRVGRLRAYGNAINAEAAEAFIRAAI